MTIPPTTDFVVQYKRSVASTWSTFPERVSTATSLTVTALVAGTSYDYRVAAVNSAGRGPWSSVVTAATATAAVRRAIPWVTTGDKSLLLAAQAPVVFSSSTGPAAANVVRVDPANSYQSIVGYGGAMTEAACWTLSQLTPTARSALMHDLFAIGSGTGFSFVRIHLGGSDFALSEYTEDDRATGTDDPLTGFTIRRDLTYLIPRLQEMMAINPAVSIVASCWSPPAWMRANYTTHGTDGGLLLPEHYDAYAQYFVKFIRAYAAHGVPIRYVTVQNEPLNAPEYMGMVMDTAEHVTFIRDHLGPAFAAANITTMILMWDYNFDRPTWPEAVLADTTINSAGRTAKSYIDGTAWHGYNMSPGPSNVGVIHNAYPSKNNYMTEYCGGKYTGTTWDVNLRDMAGTRISGCAENWVRGDIWWNIVLQDQNIGTPNQYWGPSTNGTTDSRPVVTVNTSAGTYTRNEDYYALAHYSRFVRVGASRLARTLTDPGSILQASAFKNPDGSAAVVVVNNHPTAVPLTLTYGTVSANIVLQPGVTTFAIS